VSKEEPMSKEEPKPIRPNVDGAYTNGERAAVDVPAPVAISGVGAFPLGDDRVLFQVLNPEAMPLVEWALTLEQAGQFALQTAALVDAMMQRAAQVATLVGPTGAKLTGGNDGKLN
jgi:hypothetical protein